MRINLYKCTAENRLINKHDFLSNHIQLDGYLREESDVVNPIIMIEYSDLPIYLINYCYISDFRRYYYINEITSVRTDLWRLKCHCDVLYTWGADIYNNYGIIEALEDSDSKYYNNGLLSVEARSFVQTIEFPNSLISEPKYILITAGGIV